MSPGLRPVFSLCALSMLGSGCAHPALRVGTSTAEVDLSTIRPGVGPSLVARNTVYHWTMTTPPLLIEQVQRTEIIGGVEGTYPSMRVRAFVADPRAREVAAVPSYAFTADGDDLEVGWATLRVNRLGCCGAADTVTVRDLHTGAPLYSSSGYELDLPKGKLLAVHQEESATRPLGFEGREAPCLVLFFGAREGASVDRFSRHVVERGEDSWRGPCKVEAVTLESDGVVQIQMRSPTPGTLRIPITAGDLEVGRAEVSPAHAYHFRPRT